MPIYRPPYTLHCLQCNWKQGFAGSSDVLESSDILEWHNKHPDQCPKCGSKKLKQVVDYPQRPSLAARMLTSIFK